MTASAYDSGTWDERRRLAEIISDARKLLAQDSLAPGPATEQLRQLAARIGALEATLSMLADSAARVASGSEE